VIFDVHGNVPVATGTRKPTDELSRPRGCEVEVVEGVSSAHKNKLLPTVQIKMNSEHKHDQRGEESQLTNPR